MPSAFETADDSNRAEMDAMKGATVIEFGASWCGHCFAARPMIDEVLALHPGVNHVKVEDGPGRPLGRSYHIKLWPTLVFLMDGREVARLVRPQSATQVGESLRFLTVRQGAQFISTAR